MLPNQYSKSLMTKNAMKKKYTCHIHHIIQHTYCITQSKKLYLWEVCNQWISLFWRQVCCILLYAVKSVTMKAQLLQVQKKPHRSLPNAIGSDRQPDHQVSLKAAKQKCNYTSQPIRSEHTTYRVELLSEVRPANNKGTNLGC